MQIKSSLQEIIDDNSSLLVQRNVSEYANDIEGNSNQD